jgi:hypothetical protein
MKKEEVDRLDDNKNDLKNQNPFHFHKKMIKVQCEYPKEALFLLQQLILNQQRSSLQFQSAKEQNDPMTPAMKRRKMGKRMSGAGTQTAYFF